ncbi:MAG: S49 family peptidase [Pseudomonadota bacterium]
MNSLTQRLRRKPHIPILRLDGVIASGGRVSSTLSDRALAPVIERAFARKPKAVALAINSPGGSPTQSALIAARIRRLADEKNVPVIAFCEDVAASGGYWLAVAADEIYADANSILGSIGVISASFGLHELIGRYGIERRVHTAGEDKSMLDPFRPERAEDIARLKDLQATIHQNFKDHVTDRRGAKLSQDKDLFTGEVFLAARAKDLGLIDGIGHLYPVMTEKFGKDVRFVEPKPKRGLLTRLGVPGAEDVLAAAERRLAFARFGL